MRYFDKTGLAWIVSDSTVAGPLPTSAKLPKLPTGAKLTPPLNAVIAAVGAETFTLGKTIAPKQLALSRPIAVK